MTRARLGRCCVAVGVAIVGLLAAVPLQAADTNTYTVTPLVSDQTGVAPVTDPSLVNAWGLAASSTSPWWVVDNETSLSTLYDGNSGAKLGLEVGVGTDSGPTGLVFNNSPGFQIGGVTPFFIFDGEDGVIRAWAPAFGTTAQVAPADDPPGEQIYKGLAIADGMIYAADFHNGLVDVFDGSWHLIDQFTDPTLPPGYAPFGIQAIGGQVFVTFAKQDADAEDEVAGQGLGFVDVFDTAGNMVARVAQHGRLDAPWGLALAPAGFGRFGGDLLVGNFGNGRINAYEQSPTGTYTPAGELRTGHGDPVEIDGLWALEFGNGANAGPTSTLFFTAGPDDESHGLFGSIAAG
jgi:uncharacterized protein (TIGR03118 family)